MHYVRNVFWEPFAGLYLTVAWLAVSVILFVSVIGIPLALQTVKIADFMFWPYGRAMTKRRGKRVTGLGIVAHIAWIVLAGSWLAILQTAVACLLIATIVGVPLGIALLRMVPVAIMPFDREVVETDVVSSVGDWRRRPGHLLSLPTY